MAIICAECGEIHFDSGVAPTRCRKCEADLTQVAGFAPLLKEFDDEQKAAKNKKGEKPPRKPWAAGAIPTLVGVSILVASGAAFWVGLERYNAAKETTATIVPVRGKLDPKVIRNDNTAVYTANGKEFNMYPGVRVPGTSFKVYYSPTNPANASEERPWLTMLFSGFGFLLGGLFTATGLLRMAVARARDADHRLTMQTNV
jgi:hypothetical protein